jgi:hypothetical protein
MKPGISVWGDIDTHGDECKCPSRADRRLCAVYTLLGALSDYAQIGLFWRRSAGAMVAGLASGCFPGRGTASGGNGIQP